ncbi:hypothetical protein [Rhodohalobacter sulfatireducens]|uniref:YbbR-like domain-containing protein n=1 Tax=Rhodohalobacter sulfatireducens TaxID=2911366 RepID=A0ABS9KJK1_9BACT|nr:hypothetical protein [Rhodohalobacter sulfatireducens]MCG2591040.1 hypothetical protein [Rhodohalobacter sulfatireducens]
MSFFSAITDRVRGLFSDEKEPGIDESDNYQAQNREKIIAFSIAFFISVCLWFIVNLSRDFTVTIQVPIQVASIPEDEIVSSEVPENATVNVSGEGWNIISVYNNPPRVLLTAQTEQINLSEQMRNQIGAFSDLNIIQVQPTTVTIRTEEKATKRVPIVSNVQLNLRERFGLLNEPVMTPDSVTVSGTYTAIDTVTEWRTESIELDNLNSDIQRDIALEEPGQGLFIDLETVNYQAQVAEFTEAEVRVPIRTVNLPAGRAVTYNPSSITVRFDVPIDQYSQIRDMRPFQAYVDYSAIEEDDSGRVQPEIEVVNTDFNIRLRSFQPQRVSYFRIVPE